MLKEEKSIKRTIATKVLIEREREREREREGIREG